MNSARRMVGVAAVGYLIHGDGGAALALVVYAVLAEAARIILAGVAAALPDPPEPLPVQE